MTDAVNKQPQVQDEAAGKGAVEDDGRDRGGGRAFPGQLGHRDQDTLLKQNDTDFPEPDAEAEHTGG